MHTYIYTYMHAYINTHTNTYIHTFKSAPTPFFAAPEMAAVKACKDWCLSNSQPWSRKCTWSDRCDGCPVCSGMVLVDCACDLLLL